MNEILLPEVGITLLPPWWWMILWAGKRIENRAPSVAGRLRGWTGMIAITASKVNTPAKIRLAIDEHCHIMEQISPTWVGPEPWTPRDVIARAGHIVAVAELLGTQANGDNPSDPWAIAGEHGLVLGKVTEVEPVPCTGGRGAFRVGVCQQCEKIGAYESRDTPLTCRKCGAVSDMRAANLKPRPKLIIRNIYPGKTAP